MFTPTATLTMRPASLVLTKVAPIQAQDQPASISRFKTPWLNTWQFSVSDNGQRFRSRNGCMTSRIPTSSGLSRNKYKALKRSAQIQL